VCLWVISCKCCIPVVTVISRQKSYVIESKLLFMFKASTRILYVYVLATLYLKRKYRWHSSVDYWVCYRMFHSKGTKVFPTVAYPGLLRLGMLPNGVKA
jgi:hypothetical protein